MASSRTQVHRRKSSSGDDENTIVLPEQTEPSEDSPTNVSFQIPQSRNRVASTPSPQSAGPYRTTFSVPKSPIYTMSPSPSRSSFAGSGHSRARSISTPYSPPLPSPLSFSFPRNDRPPPIAASSSAPNATSPIESSSPHSSRRHARLHSRNLSVFFPRPGSLPSTAISEDGSQELDIPDTPIPSKPRTPLGAGFTFGARPPSDAGASDLPVPPLLGKTGSSTRRGHHHKHSLSHNFFSFLEPSDQLLTQPTPTPVSQWSAPVTPVPARTPSPVQPEKEPQDVETGAVAMTFGQFLLGAWLWVCGQQIGSLACTGLGYWVVFDSFGIGLTSVIPAWLGPGLSKTERAKRPYGNARVETVLFFSQAVYLMFSSVYVCKETVEHILLSMGGGDGHHHHHGDEVTGFGIEWPLLSIVLALGSMAGSAFFFNNHSKLVDVTGNRIPSPGAFIRSLSSTHHIHDPPPTARWAVMLSNPYTLSPLLFGACILLVASLVPESQHSACDLVIAALITVVTFNVSYSAAFVLGTVLLQTSPPRGTSTRRTEAFLRAMREVERHPQVLHLPAPHIWQLTPGKGGGTLIVTLEVHVRGDLPDEDVLTLTKWAYDRCSGALGGEREVTVGVVKG